MTQVMLLSKEEDVVFDVIQDYMNNNRVFKTDKIVPFIRNNFSRNCMNINEKGIRAIVEALVEKKVIIQGSKITKAIVLQNSNRRKIYNFIKDNPGLYLNRLIKDLNLPNHVITWHVDILVKFGLIKTQTFDRHETYFHPKIKPSDYQGIYIISKMKSKNILTYIDSKPKGTTKTSISKNLGIHYNTVSKYIALLEKSGIIRSEKLSNKTLYFINKKL